MKTILKKIVSVTSVAAMILSMVACGTTGESSLSTSQTSDKSTSTENPQITVMVPPWAEPSPELLEEFTATHHIQVEMNIVGWDEIKNKVSMAAVGNKAAADVVEIDWSWVGEFGAADWLEPIQMTQEEKDGIPTVSSFMYGDAILAVPYINDFRLAYYNMEHFKEVGIEEAPETWEDVIEGAKEIKEKDIVEYPIAMAVSAGEAATTTLLWMTLSSEGEMFNEDFTMNKENVMGALTTINQLANEDMLIDPANQTMKDIEVYGKLTAGDASFMVGPTHFIGKINNPEFSTVVGELSAALVPGTEDIKTATFALPEGLGISKYSQYKAESKIFIDWYTSPEVQTTLYKDQGNVPTRTVALEDLIDEELIIGGDVLIAQSEHISAPFPQGIPYWYSEMSNTFYNSVSQMVAGAITIEEAYTNMETTLAELVANA